ncbi:tyrosyl-DNA phosphodiesterase 2 [Astyanax mexicanus]|uniref:Tyrosyl-DNA phosphodiesterase 2 n=1 Tax=Astyanax mexicanus TaxID=7994 RepID=A0A8B9KEG8_ASTMX|nr:tyrosyl-DNA phosphodiesterase 2 [Astyanax mexicanus]
MRSSEEGMEDLEQTRLRQCGEFSTITGSDTAVAQCYLAENDWDMERALNSFFEADMESVFDVEDRQEERAAGSKRKETPRTENTTVTTDEDAPVIKKRMNSSPQDCIDLTAEEPACSSSTSSKENADDGDSKLSLISWNVDGLDTLGLAERARGLCSYLALYTPDVVFLQELIPQYAQYVKKRAVSYLFIEGNEEGYFTGLMLKKSRVKLQKSEIISFPTTQMMRNLLCAQVTFMGKEVCLMTSHFESCKDQATERMKQLGMVLQKIKEAPDNMTVIFGGDTNLRDSEVAKVGGLPAGVIDVWEDLGKQEHCRYTWDTKMNSNKNVSYVSRCRFDRIYVRSSKTEPRVSPEHMALVGMEKLDCGRYTSDHWGIYCTFTT